MRKSVDGSLDDIASDGDAGSDGVVVGCARGVADAPHAGLNVGVQRCGRARGGGHGHGEGGRGHGRGTAAHLRERGAAVRREA